MPGDRGPSSALPRVSCADGYWLALPAVLLSALLLLPYLDKAFTIDDTLFLLQAQQALADPLHPTAFEVVWSDTVQRLSAIMPSGPVMAYLLMPAVARGGSEPIAHLIQLAVLCLGLLHTAVLALRLGCSRIQAAAAALLMASSPAVMGMAATAMPDIAAMSFGVLGIERFVAFLQSPRRGLRIVHALIAAVALALAALSRSHAGLLLGVAGLFAVGDTLFDLRLSSLPSIVLGWLRPRRLQQLWPIPLAVAFIGAALLVSRDPHSGTGVVSSTRFFATISAWPRNFIGFLSALALTLPLSIPWAILRPHAVSQRALWMGAVLAVIGIALTVPAICLPVAPVVALSALCLADLIRSAWQRRDKTDLALTAWLFLSAPVLFYIHFAPKYPVPSAPAVCILICRLLLPLRDPHAAPPSQRGTRVALAAVAVGSLLSVLIVRTDAAFADLGRRAARELIAPQVQRGERVWFCGHWGFQWYAQKAGAHPMTRTPPLPQPGDLIAASLRAECHLMPLVSKHQTLASVSDSRFGGRIMALEAGAGFFSNGAGFYPFMFSTKPLDQIDLVRVLAAP